LVALLSATVGGRGDAEALLRVLRWLAAPQAAVGRASPEWRLAILDGLLQGVRRAPRLPPLSPSCAAVLETLFQDPAPPVRQRALRLAAALQLSSSPRLRQFWSTLRGVALDRQKAPADRLNALEQLSGAPWEEIRPLHTLLVPQETPEVQLATVRLWAEIADTGVPQILLARFSSLSPGVQAAILETCFSRREWQPYLLEALEKGLIPLSQLTAVQRTQLLKDSRPALRERAHKVLTARTDNMRAKVLQEYQRALKLPRNPRRGRELFLKHCASCHRLENEGAEVGPPLTEAKNRPDPTLLADIFDPSSVISPGFQTYVVTTTDGRIFTGILRAETATSITLRQEKGVELVLLRQNIDQMQVLPQSLMPEGFEKQLSPQDLADLLGYLRSVPAAASAAPRK
jgi:putative heme-binding domain-containing protein